jgi:hypothetical protein
VFSIIFVGMCMIYLCTQFHKPNCSGFIAYHHETQKLNTDLMQLPFYSHTCKKILTTVTYFSKTNYHMKFQDHILSGASNTPSSQACLSVMLILLINFKKYEFGVGSSGKMSNPNLI